MLLIFYLPETHIEPKLNAAKMIIEDYYHSHNQENVLNGDALMHNTDEF